MKTKLLLILTSITVLISCSKEELPVATKLMNEKEVNSNSAGLISPDDFTLEPSTRVMLSTLIVGEYNLKRFDRPGIGCPPDGDKCKKVSKSVTVDFEKELLDFEDGVLNGPITLKQYFEQDIYIPLSVQQPDIYKDYTSGLFSAVKVVEDSVHRYLFGENPSVNNYKYEIIIEQ